MRSSSLIIFCLVLSLSGIAGADIIYFKDGMKTVCQGKAWEEKDEVKCDYNGVILTYRKEDVEEIHQTFIPVQADETPSQPAPSPNLPIEQMPAINPASDMTVDGTAFYDPRRQFKYWSSPTAKHSSYHEAVNALAQEFGHSPEWVEAHIGKTNNLDVIRKNMASQEMKPAVADPLSPSPEPQVNLQFYNPRRDYKYQISETEKYHSYKEAINALAAEFDKTAQWVEKNMGPQNDIGIIRKNLSRNKETAAD